MVDADKWQILSLRDASIYMGCAPADLLALKRLGWLRSLDELQNKQSRKRIEARFWLWQLDVLTWDIAYGLSFWDIAAIRMNDQDATTLAKETGIFVRVIQLVRDVEVFAGIHALLERYAPRRTAKNISEADVHLPTGNWHTFPRLIPRLVSASPMRTSKKAANPSRLLPGIVATPPGGSELGTVDLLTSRGRRQMKIKEHWTWNQGTIKTIKIDS